VPLDDVYIDANFKETQLQRIRPGQPVTISVDAYGQRKFAGTVDSISPAAGSVFTLLRPTTPPATSPRSCSACRSAFACRREVARQNLLRAACRSNVTVDSTKGAEDADSKADLDSPMMIHPQ